MSQNLKLLEKELQKINRQLEEVSGPKTRQKLINRKQTIKDEIKKLKKRQ